MRSLVPPPPPRLIATPFTYKAVAEMVPETSRDTVGATVLIPILVAPPGVVAARPK
jgi:hypothetical protein